MPNNVFGNSSNNSDNKIDTSLFVKKPYLRHNYIETDIDHDINLKNQYRIINIANPINDKDSVNKIYIDNKIVYIIKKNIQNNDYISFLDNDNNEYRLVKYHDEKLLTDETLFSLNNIENRTNTKWNSENLDQNGSDALSSLIAPKKSGLYSGALINKEDNTNAFLVLYSGRMINDNSFNKLERRDIHNIRHIKIVYARPNLDNTSGRFIIFLLNNPNQWIEVLKFDNDGNLTDDYIWAVEDIDIDFKNYGIMLKYDNVKSNKQDMAISRIILTYAVK